MANILFTTYCNRKCSYCFAMGKVDLGKDTGDATKNLDLESLEKIIEFYKKSRINKVVALGGEPTLNPHFNNLVSRLLNESYFETIRIFTNGIMPKKVFNYLSNLEDNRIKIAVNLNAPNSYSPDEQKSINSVFRAFGPKLSIGINITNSNQEYKYLIDTIVSYNLAPQIRLGLTQPIVGKMNMYAQESDLKAIASDLMAFAKLTYDNGIIVSFDCGFPFCMFTLEQHKELLRYGYKFKSYCRPIIDIGIDLSIWRCFPLVEDVCGTLGQYDRLDDIKEHYKKKYKNYINAGYKKECIQCRYRMNRLCSGGCLARKLITSNAENEVSQMLKK